MARTIEEISAEHKVEWERRDYAAAAVLLREARDVVGDTGRAVQQSDGSIQFVPNE